MSEATPESPALKSFTVAVAATTLTTGNVDPSTHKAEVIRLVRGDTINADPALDQIRVLRGMRAIVPTEKFEGADTRLTTRRVFQIWQRAGEPIVEETKGIAPVDAPLEEVKAAQS